MLSYIFAASALLPPSTGFISSTDCVTVADCPYVAECAVPSADAAEEPFGINISADGEIYTYIDKPVIPSDFTVADEIFIRRINAPIDERIELADEYLQKGADFKTALAVSFPMFVKYVDALAQKLYVAPVEAAVKYVNGEFRATEGKSGRKLDEQRLYGAAYYAFKYRMKDTVRAATVPVEPKMTAAQLRKNLKVRGEYTTDFTSSSNDRAHNVALALEKIDGFKLAPGETFSFNAVVGERSVENGFKTSKIIVDGKYVDGVGGGACQASTAVYNAALVAGLKTVANAHSIAPSYCPPGLDAMISTVSDLLIKNTTDHDVYFSCRVNGKRATVKIVGAPNELCIVPESMIKRITVHENTEFLDVEHKYSQGAVSGDRMLIAPGKDGYESETYLNVYKNGALISRELIRANVYKSTPRVTAVAP